MNRIVLLTTFILCVFVLQFSPRGRAAATSRTGADWFFIVVEARVHKKDLEIDDAHPEERRWYISNTLALPDNIPSYSAKKKAIEYFDANVVEPAKKNGITVEYYDQELELNGGSVLAVGSRAEAEEMRNKDISDRKEQGGNIYSFNFTFGPAKGEETSQPHLIYRNKEQPNYEVPKKP